MMTSQESRQYLSFFEMYAQYCNMQWFFGGVSILFLAVTCMYLFTFDIEIIDIVLHGIHNHKKKSFHTNAN